MARYRTLYDSDQDIAFLFDSLMEIALGPAFREANLPSGKVLQAQENAENFLAWIDHSRFALTHTRVNALVEEYKLMLEGKDPFGDES